MALADSVNRRWRRSPRIVREGTWIFAAQIGGALGGLVGVRLLTSLMTREHYGHLVILLGLVALGSNVLGFPVLSAAQRFFPEALVAGRVGAFRGMVVADLRRAIAAAMAILLVGGAAYAMVSASAVPFAGFAAAAMLLAADAVRSLETSLLNASRRQREFAVRTLFDSWGRVALAVLLAWSVSPTAAAVLVGYAAASASVSWSLRRHVVSGDGAPGGAAEPWIASIRSSYLAFALPLLPLALLNWLPSLADRYILAGMTGTGAAGVYGAAYGLASQPFILVGAFIHSTLRPVLYEAVVRRDRSKERRTMGIWIASVLGVCGTGVLLLAILAPWVAKVFLGPVFRAPAVALLPWVGGAYALQAVQHAMEARIYAHRRTRRLLLLQIVAATASLALYLVLIPSRGALGAAQATLAAFVITVATATVLASWGLSTDASPGGNPEEEKSAP